MSLVVITGSSSGIGLATARLFSERGHPLLLISRRGDCAGDALPNAIYAQVDVTDFEAVRKAVSEAEERFGPVGVLVNNAGVMQLGFFENQDPTEWDRMIDVNLKGVLNGVRAVLPTMYQQKSGTVVNVSSVAGRKAFANHGVYCGTKFGVHAMTDVLRAEAAAHGVRCITIAPGIVETELLSQTTNDAIRAGYERFKQVVGTCLNPSDVADAILYAVEASPHVCMREIVICPTGQRD